MSWKQIEEERCNRHRAMVHHILNRVRDFYGNDEWLYICHPQLGYESPISWLKSGKSEGKVKEILENDIMFISALVKE